MHLQQIFMYQENEVRTVVQDGTPWFVANDVCRVLEIGNASAAVGRLDQDEKGLISIDTLGGQQTMICVNEQGVYELIFGSRKKEAKAFKNWLKRDVIPAIRKTGGYVANDDLFIDTYLPHADDQTKLMFKSTLHTLRKQNEQIAVLQPKGEYYDSLIDRNSLTNFRDTAKELQIKESQFINMLLDKGYVYRDRKGKLKPYAQYVPALFQMKEWASVAKADVQTLITVQGKEKFRQLIQQEKGVSA